MSVRSRVRPESPPAGRARRCRRRAGAAGVATALACCLTLAGCTGSAVEDPPGLAVEVPRLRVAGGDRFPDHADRIRRLDSRRLAHAMKFLGLRDAGDPIRLVLLPEGSPAARRTPSWIAGYAFSADGVAVLFPERTPTYPDSTFEELVLHEVAHVLVERASASRPLPRWFNEGLALFIGRPWRLEDRSRLTWALLSGRQVALSSLEPYFHSDRAAAGHAYALAGAFVQDLVRRQGGESIARILAAIAAGASFEEAFRQTAGIDLAQAEVSFWGRHTFWYRWIPVLTSSLTLWLGVTALALLAFRRRRARDAALRELWDEQERRLDDSDPSSVAVRPSTRPGGRSEAGGAKR